MIQIPAPVCFLSQESEYIPIDVPWENNVNCFVPEIHYVLPTYPTQLKPSSTQENEVSSQNLFTNNVIPIISPPSEPAYSTCPTTFKEARQCILLNVATASTSLSTRFILRGFISRRRACSKKLIFLDIIDQNLTIEAEKTSPITQTPTISSPDISTSALTPIFTSSILGSYFGGILKYPCHNLETIKNVSKNVGVGDFCEFDVICEKNDYDDIILHILSLKILVSHVDNLHYPILQQRYLAFLRTTPEKSNLSDTEIQTQIEYLQGIVQSPEWTKLYQRLLDITKFTSDAVTYANITMMFNNRAQKDQKKSTLIENKNQDERCVELNDENSSLTNQGKKKRVKIAPVCSAWWKNRCQLASTQCSKRHAFLSIEEEKIFIEKRKKRLRDILEDVSSDDPYLSQQQLNILAVMREILQTDNTDQFIEIEKSQLWQQFEECVIDGVDAVDAMEKDDRGDRNDDIDECNIINKCAEEEVNIGESTTDIHKKQILFPQYVGKKLPKINRASIFIQWLEMTFQLSSKLSHCINTSIDLGDDEGDNGSGNISNNTQLIYHRKVCDIAGGKGDISFELLKFGLPSVVIDPRPVTLSKTHHRFLSQLIDTGSRHLDFFHRNRSVNYQQMKQNRKQGEKLKEKQSCIDIKTKINFGDYNNCCEEPEEEDIQFPTIPIIETNIGSSTIQTHKNKKQKYGDRDIKSTELEHPQENHGKFEQDQKRDVSENRNVASSMYSIPQYQEPFYLSDILYFLRTFCPEYRKVSTFYNNDAKDRHKYTEKVLQSQYDAELILPAQDAPHVQLKMLPNERYQIPYPLPDTILMIIQRIETKLNNTIIDADAEAETEANIDGIVDSISINRYYIRNINVLRIIQSVLTASIFVGMHADQATEDTLLIGILLQKPSVVVPCCVFPSLFFDRKYRELSTNEGTAGLDNCDNDVKQSITWNPVISYSQFITYLQQSHSLLRTSYLPVIGRNTIIYYDGSEQM